MKTRKDLQIISEIIKPKSKVLDLGCGDGELLRILTKEKGITGFGIEISLESIKKCLEFGVSVVQEDLNEGLKEFQPNSFDYVVLSQTLEDISKPAHLIQDMLRIGKKCIISFENIAYWKNRISFLFRGTLKSRGISDDLIRNYEKQQIITINKYLKFCTHYNFKICKKIYLPKRRLNLSKAFPNFYSRTAIFILEGNQ